ncbi:MAG: HAMP domain-containing sensor histidine kinase, partial [Bacteroidia bacterium]|nr:HAMP domain-containing histidine kinase [Bacteroidia bacterium]MDW8133609.1 HAMP domain-containing sensor histidine kinase [Bacteroidia bacterium]
MVCLVIGVILGLIAALMTAWGVYEHVRRKRLERKIVQLVGSPHWESALQALLNRLRRQEIASQAQQGFITAVSHELKTPLAILLGYLDTLVQGAWQDKEVLLPFLEKSLAQIHRMNSLVQDILLLAQIESGGWLIQPEPTPLYPLLEEVWSELEPLARTKGISLKRPPHHLQDLSVEADPFALRKILKNLLENAIQYSPENRTVTVNWNLSPDGKNVKFCIQDEGIGIAPEHL